MGPCFSSPADEANRLTEKSTMIEDKVLNKTKALEPASVTEQQDVVKAQDAAGAYKSQLDHSKAGLPYKYYEAGPPPPPCEDSRLETLRALHLEDYMQLEAPPDPEIDNILKLVTAVFQAPNALVALFDDRRIFVTAAKGGFQKGDFPWRHSMCAWTMASQNDSIMVVPDTLTDARFSENPYVKDGGVRFYCGAPLVASNGHRLGTLCFADSKPREFEAHQACVLNNFAEMVVRHIEKDIALQLRSQDNAALSSAYRNLKRAIDCFDHCVVLLDTTKEGWSILYTNPAWDKLTATSRKDLPGSKLSEVLEVRSGALPDKSHCSAVAAGKMLTIDFARVKNTWVAKHGLDSANSSSSLSKKSKGNSGTLIKTVSDRSSQSRSGSTAKRLILKLRPAGDSPLDDDAVGLAVPPWVASKGLKNSPLNEGSNVSGYYFMTIEAVDSFTSRTSALSSRHSMSSFASSSPLAGLSLGALLGTGSFGSVYSGTWCGSPVAIKVINQDMRSLAAAGVQMEALLGSELRHPHIVGTLTYATRAMTPNVSGNMFSDDTARNIMQSQGTPAAEIGACVLNAGENTASTPHFLTERDVSAQHTGHTGGISLRKEDERYAPRDLSGDMDYASLRQSDAGMPSNDKQRRSTAGVTDVDANLNGGDIVSGQTHSSSATLNVGGRYAVIQMPVAEHGTATDAVQQLIPAGGIAHNQAIGNTMFKDAFLSKLSDFDHGSPVPELALSAIRSEPCRPANQLIHQTWIVLEYCDKGSLQDAVDRGWLRTAPSQITGPPNMYAIASTALEISSALLYLHSHGIVHGDLSAWNVLLTTSGSTALQGGRGFVAKVADFGLSRCLDVKTRIQTKTYGTITHQPPETLLHGLVSRETDTYSLGVLLWQMFTGSRPWAGMTHAQIIMAVASQASRLQFPDDTPDAYAALAYACLDYDATKRPSMAEVCKTLESMKAKYAGTDAGH